MAAYPKQLYTTHEKTFELYRSLATRKSRHVFWQLLPLWRPIPLGPQPIPDAGSVFRVSVDDPLDFERLEINQSESLRLCPN